MQLKCTIKYVYIIDLLWEYDKVNSYVMFNDDKW